ncbi:unnamed protein product, partial [Laminaria digitata]
TLRQAHSNAKAGEAEWPHRSNLSGGAAASSPRRRHDGDSPRRGRRDSGRHGRSSDGSTSRHNRPGKQKNRRLDDNSSSSRTPARRTKADSAKKDPKEEPDS